MNVLIRSQLLKKYEKEQNRKEPQSKRQERKKWGMPSMRFGERFGEITIEKQCSR